MIVVMGGDVSVRKRKWKGMSRWKEGCNEVFHVLMGLSVDEFSVEYFLSRE